MNSFGINVKVYSVAQILAPSHDFRYDSTMKFAILEFFWCVHGIEFSIFSDQMKMMSEYEEVNATNNNCVTMITVMPGTTRSTLTSSGSEAVLELATSSTRESETSSSEGGSFIIDSTAFYENLSFHRMRCSNILASR